MYFLKMLYHLGAALLEGFKGLFDKSTVQTNPTCVDIVEECQPPSMSR